MQAHETEQERRWRLILGQKPNQQDQIWSSDDLNMHQCLDQLYRPIKAKGAYSVQIRKLPNGSVIYASIFQVQWFKLFKKML